MYGQASSIDGLEAKAQSLLQEMITAGNTDIPVSEDEIREYPSHTHAALRELLGAGLVVIEGDSYTVSSTADLNEIGRAHV